MKTANEAFLMRHRAIMQAELSRHVAGKLFLLPVLLREQQCLVLARDLGRLTEADFQRQCRQLNFQLDEPAKFLRRYRKYVRQRENIRREAWGIINAGLPQAEALHDLLHEADRWFNEFEAAPWSAAESRIFRRIEEILERSEKLMVVAASRAGTHGRTQIAPFNWRAAMTRKAAGLIDRAESRAGELSSVELKLELRDQLQAARNLLIAGQVTDALWYSLRLHTWMNEVAEAERTITAAPAAAADSFNLNASNFEDALAQLQTQMESAEAAEV